jgi:hypothetical protein
MNFVQAVAAAAEISCGLCVWRSPFWWKALELADGKMLPLTLVTVQARHHDRPDGEIALANDAASATQPAV